MHGKWRHEGGPGFVELQLLRHGPPHNQLLSPLTEYLALCGDHSNTTLRIPLEHSALLTRLRALRYFDSEQTRIDQLRETARIASEMLAKVPGLIADLSSDRAGGRPFVHLSIASRASELALFPFELAVAPDGFPGAGQPLCLQKQLPVCLTRRSKNVQNNDFDWDRPVRILFVASDAGGEVPVQQHYALLRKLVEPWVGTMPSDDAESRTRKRRPILRLVTEASVNAIRRVICNEINDYGEPFTHIHVLAHGCDLPETDQRFGVAFHHPSMSGTIDAVDGKRLAEALGCLPDYPSASKRLRGPTVVTLATCDSGGQGGVTIPGASLAFELHDSGVPLVVGSQFPLSSEGSIVMTEALFRGFLAGRDPRSVIWEARQALQAELAQLLASGKDVERVAHDWASMTVYAALPPNLDWVLPGHRRSRQRKRMDVRLENMHRLLEELQKQEQQQDGQRENGWWPNFQLTLSDADKAVRKFDKWVRSHKNVDVAARVTNQGILASAQKQIGLLYLRASVLGSSVFQEADSKTNSWAEEGEQLLRASRQSYWRIFELSRDESWALVQFLALDLALRAAFDDTLWTVARQLSLLEQYVADVRRRVWALAALLELRFMQWLSSDLKQQQLEADENARELAERLRNLFHDEPWEVFSAKRQFDRYVRDFAELARSSRLDQKAQHYRVRRETRTSERKTRRESPPSDSAAEDKINDVLRVFDDLDFGKLRRESRYV